MLLHAVECNIKKIINIILQILSKDLKFTCGPLSERAWQCICTVEPTAATWMVGVVTTSDTDPSSTVGVGRPKRNNEI